MTAPVAKFCTSHRDTSNRTNGAETTPLCGFCQKAQLVSQHAFLLCFARCRPGFYANRWSQRENQGINWRKFYHSNHQISRTLGAARKSLQTLCCEHGRYGKKKRMMEVTSHIFFTARAHGARCRQLSDRVVCTQTHLYDNDHVSFPSCFPVFLRTNLTFLKFSLLSLLITTGRLRTHTHCHTP